MFAASYVFQYTGHIWQDIVLYMYVCHAYIRSTETILYFLPFVYFATEDFGLSWRILVKMPVLELPGRLIRLATLQKWQQYLHW